VGRRGGALLDKRNQTHESREYSFPTAAAFNSKQASRMRRASESIGRSRRSPDRNHAEPGIEIYMDVQDQVARPSGKRAKFNYGPCSNRDAGFHLDSQVIAVAKKKLLHFLDRSDCIPRHFVLFRRSDWIFRAIGFTKSSRRTITLPHFSHHR